MNRKGTEKKKKIVNKRVWCWFLSHFGWLLIKKEKRKLSLRMRRKSPQWNSNLYCIEFDCIIKIINVLKSFLYLQLIMDLFNHNNKFINKKLNIFLIIFTLFRLTLTTSFLLFVFCFIFCTLFKSGIQYWFNAKINI